MPSSAGCVENAAQNCQRAAPHPHCSKPRRFGHTYPMKMSRFGLCSLGILALAATLAAQAPAGAAAGAQGRGAAPAPPQNLQVLPAGTDIRATMQAYAQGLGV